MGWSRWLVASGERKLEGKRVFFLFSANLEKKITLQFSPNYRSVNFTCKICPNNLYYNFPLTKTKKYYHWKGDQMEMLYNLLAHFRKGYFKKKRKKPTI